MQKFITKRIIFLLFVSLILFFISFSNAYAFEKTETGLVKIEGLPEFTDKEFLSTPIRLEVYAKSWCQYCIQLENEMIPEIYKQFTPKQVAVRILDAEHPKVDSHFQKIQDLFDMENDKKGKVPVTIVNGEILILGYGGKGMTDDLIIGFKQILEGKEYNTIRGFSLKKGLDKATNQIIYQEKGNDYLESLLGSLPESETSVNTSPNKELTKPAILEHSQNKNGGNSSTNTTYFYAIQGVYDTLKRPFLGLILPILLYFIAYDKKKLTTLSILYVIGLIAGNGIVRVYDVGVYETMKPISVLFILLFILISLFIAWNIVFKTISKKYQINIKMTKNKSEDEPYFLLKQLNKIINSKLVYGIIPLFAFVLCILTTPFEIEYGAIFQNDGKFNFVWLIINGLCVSFLSIILGYIVSMGKKLNTLIIEQTKNYNLCYWGVAFYCILSLVLLYSLFKL